MEGQGSSHIGGTGLRLSYWRDRPDKRTGQIRGQSGKRERMEKDLEQGEAFELRALRGLGIEIKLARVPKRRIKKTADRNLSKDPMTRRQVRLAGRNWNDLSR
jgi:hypothetical protein